MVQSRTGVGNVVPLMVRVPEDLRARIRRHAVMNGRSQNSEIVAALEEKYPDPAYLTHEELNYIMGLFTPDMSDTEISSMISTLNADLVGRPLGGHYRVTIASYDRAKQRVQFEFSVVEESSGTGDGAGYGDGSGDGSGGGSGYGDGDGAYGDSDGEGDGFGDPIGDGNGNGPRKP